MVDRIDRHRDEGVYIEKIGKDKKDQEKFQDLTPDQDKKILRATFFSYLKKMFDTFSPSKNLTGKVVDYQTVFNHLEEWKKLLKKLRQEDLSRSAPFAISLSDTWCELLEDFDQVEILERKNLQNVSSFRTLMDTMKNYPPDSEHRLGYYLVQHAGKDWIPFPFIEILEKLHKDHIEKGAKSTLSNWENRVDGVIHGLKRVSGEYFEEKK